MSLRFRHFVGAFTVLSLSTVAAAQKTHPADTAPPDTVALLKDVQAHQKAVESIRDNYTFHEAFKDEKLDGKDRVTETRTEEAEVFYAYGRRIVRVLKRDGKELSPQEREKEDNRVRKLLEGQAKHATVEDKERSGGRGFVSLMLAAAKLSNPRRVDFRGRPTLVVDFTGDPSADTHGVSENAVRKIAGTMWIDDADHQVARMEAHFYDNFRIAGFLVTISKGSSFTIDQAPVGDGLWMQTVRDFHLAARLLIKGLRNNIHVEDSEFRRFDTATVQKIGSVKEH